MLHAVWNALAKRARDQLVFLWSSVSLASVVLVPVGLLGLPEGGVPAAAVPYVVATIVIHAGYFVTLGRAYRHGDFSRVYPIARGLGVALVPVAALVVFGERLSPLGTVGVALVVAGVAGLHLAVGWRGGGRPRPRGAGTAWALPDGAPHRDVLDRRQGRRHPPPPAPVHRPHGARHERAPHAGGGARPAGPRPRVAGELAHDRRRLVDEPHELPARALRLPSLEGRLRRGGTRALHPLLDLDREPLARRGTAPAPARGRLDRAGGCRLRRARALIQSEGASAAPSEASPRRGCAGKARARMAVGPTRGYRRPN